jgi:CopG family nickel-responsive transcriptional regulator
MWKYEEEGVANGTITAIYDHEVKGLEESLTDTQHLYKGIINSAMHIHLDEKNCLLVIAVKGEVKATMIWTAHYMNHELSPKTQTDNLELTKKF